MSRLLSIWVAAVLLAFCRGENIVNEESSLSASGYHLCVRNETRTVTFLAIHKVPYTVTKPCGGWLLWKTCTVKLYRMTHQTEYKTVTDQVTSCCDGYVQVGRYCAMPVNRSGELTAKPGSCPTADGLYPRSKDCEWDTDCPGWQKCCQGSTRFLCSDPARSANYSENVGHRFNATVIVKTDYEQLISKDRGLLNHTRLLKAMVTEALQFDVSVHYISSWPVHPYRTATALLIDCSFTLSLYNVTSKLHFLLKRIEEVSSVTVEDVDECEHPALQHCSPQAYCNNTVGSYQCACHQGYTDSDPSNPGTYCKAEVGMSATTDHLFTSQPPMSTIYSLDSSTIKDTQGNNSTEKRVTTALNHTGSVSYNSSHVSTSPGPNSTAESPRSTTPCLPSSIVNLWAANVTGTSFCVFWSGQFQTNQTYRVAVRKGSEVTGFWETSQSMITVTGLQHGVLYSVTVTPWACGSQGFTLHASVRTDAQTLDATTRFTNIQFTADLQNTSSQAYKNLSDSFIAEIYQALSPEMKAMLDSDQIRIEIRGFFPGSVVVNFTIIYIPSQLQDVSNVSTAVFHSLMNSTKYTMDQNNTHINDFNECTLGENDCSQWATCENTWASFTCVCLNGFKDNNPERPGRACQANSSFVTTSTAPTTTITKTSAAQISATAATTYTLAIATITSPTTSIAAKTTTATDPATTSAAATTIITAPTTTTAAASTIIFAPTTTSPATTTIFTAPAATNAAATTIFAAPTTTITATTTITSPTTTNAAAIATLAAPRTTITATTTITSPTTTNAAAIATLTAPRTTTAVGSITMTVPTTTTAVASTTMTVPTTTTAVASTTMTVPTTTTAVASTTMTVPTTTTAVSTTNIIARTTTTATGTATITTHTITSPTTTTTPKTSTSSNMETTMTSKTNSPTNPAPIMSATTPRTTSTNPRTTNTAPIANSAASVAPSSASKGAISVQCRGAAIIVTVARDFLIRTNIRESSLYLGLLECSVNGGNATHVQLTVAWNECAIRLVHNQTHYMASVTLFNNMDQYISPTGTVEVPRIRLEVPIVCAYMKSILISADFSSMGYDMFKDAIMGSGSFQVTVQLMNGTMPLPHNYSLYPEEAVVVDVSLNTSSEQIKVVINKCWATPTQNPGDTYSYVFLENSCSLNAYTKVLTNGNSSTSRVSVQIFSFVNLDVIYLHCHVQICAQIGSDSCVPDCLQRTSRSSHNTVATAFGSTGPLLKSDEEHLDEDYSTLQIIGISCLGIGLSVCFIVAFICLFYYQRNRIGHYNFNVKPKQENFTYLVFNT